ncbi:MAG: glycine betaine ABC transporter substrate-binding protein [Planctomycetota bacterium]|nr:glycine betaine ABC transporter substrate-binding protein [Planctomycetota bacterium]
MIRTIAIIGVLVLLAFAPLSMRSAGIRIGSKKFTESVVLGEMINILCADTGIDSVHYRELGGTQLVYQALLQGEIDAYPEYTGTITEEILSGEEVGSLEEMRLALAEQGVGVSQPVGFNNTYALAMNRGRARELGIERVSDLSRYPDLTFGFSSEFLNREDGWPNLREHYDLPQQRVAGLDHDIAYRQLKTGSIDVMEAYSTDAKIDVYDLKLLEDDRAFFPRYDAVLLYRQDLKTRAPEVIESILRMENLLDAEAMISLNRRVEVDRISEGRAAAEFLEDTLGIESEVADTSRWQRIAARTGEHLDLVRQSLIPAILLAIPLGIVAAKRPRFGQGILGIVGVVQTIPSLALLVILMPLVAWLGLNSIGLGSTTAVTALSLYSLLPIVRSTHTGLRGISPEYSEAALAIGLSPWDRLVRIELPLAAPSILSGVKTAAVLNVGFATLGALIGAGGYGQPIITGIRLNDTALILEGAVPAAVLALLVQAGFDLGEKWWVPRGLRLQANS